MDNIAQISREYVGTTKLCLCNANHQVCLNCTRCRAKDPDQTAIDHNQINQYIDHTLLKPDATHKDIDQLIKGGEIHGFKAICVNPCFVKYVKENLFQSPLLICTVIGFPLGTSTIETKIHETQNAIFCGADEVDMVINIAMLKERQLPELHNEINSIHQVCVTKNITLKVIIETCLLTTEEIILASLIAKQAGADFVKTSTGFSHAGADIVSVKLIRGTVGNLMGVKASGGIKTYEQMKAMLEAGANRIGTSSGVEILAKMTM